MIRSRIDIFILSYSLRIKNTSKLVKPSFFILLKQINTIQLIKVYEAGINTNQLLLYFM